MEDFDNNLIRSLSKVYYTYKDFDPIIGGSTALYILDNRFRIPKDIDVYFPYSKSNIINELPYIPYTPIKLDWGFYEDLYDWSNPLELNFGGVNIKIQSVLDVYRCKLDYIDKKYTRKYLKHKDDLNYIKQLYLGKIKLFQYNKNFKIINSL